MLAHGVLGVLAAALTCSPARISSPGGHQALSSTPASFFSIPSSASREPSGKPFPPHTANNLRQAQFSSPNQTGTSSDLSLPTPPTLCARARAFPETSADCTLPVQHGRGHPPPTGIGPKTQNSLGQITLTMLRGPREGLTGSEGSKPGRPQVRAALPGKPQQNHLTQPDPSASRLLVPFCSKGHSHPAVPTPPTWLCAPGSPLVGLREPSVGVRQAP